MSRRLWGTAGSSPRECLGLPTGSLRAGCNLGGAESRDWLKVCVWHFRKHPRSLCAALEIKKAGPIARNQTGVSRDRKAGEKPCKHQSGWTSPQQGCGRLRSQAVPLRSFCLNVGISILHLYEYLRLLYRLLWNNEISFPCSCS